MAQRAMSVPEKMAGSAAGLHAIRSPNRRAVLTRGLPGSMVLACPAEARSCFRRAVLPDAGVTVYSGDMGDTLPPKGGGMPCVPNDAHLTPPPQARSGDGDAERNDSGGVGLAHRHRRRRGWRPSQSDEVAFRESAAGAGLQIPFELKRARLGREFQHHHEAPRTMRSGVDGAAGIVSLETARDVGRHAAIRSSVFVAAQEVDESLLTGHGPTCARTRAWEQGENAPGFHAQPVVRLQKEHSA